MTDPFALWRAELKEATPEERRLDRPTEPEQMQGYWRNIGPKTGYDQPVFIGKMGEGRDECVAQFGAYAPKRISEHGERWHKFVGFGWLKCIAVSKGDWHQAMDTGFWPDGKPSRRMSDVEKHGIDVSEGDNAAPIDQSIKDQIDALVEKAAGLKVTNDEEARIANETAEKLNVLFKLGDAQRAAEKAPFDESSKAVQAKWLPIITPASAARERLIGSKGIVKTYLRAEQEKLDAERALVAPPDADGRSEPPPRARAASTFGRATGLRKVQVAAVENPLTLCQYFIDQNDAGLADYLLSRAAAALRGKVVLPGTISREELQ